MRTVLAVLVLAVVSSATAKLKNGFTRFPSWNTRMYPVWNDGDPRYRDAWRGGEVKITVGNDAPTLIGAKVTFTIDLEFPPNQKVLPSGEVVWAQDCKVDGAKYRASEPVYPAQKAEWSGVFPDSTPFKKDRRPRYVFVWKTRGQYWQVADGPSSSLTISTDGIPLGSYPMDVIIYHYRSEEKFIPLGYASTQFSITDQIPFAVSLSQVNDIHEADLSFVQNRAISFSIALHDPSHYLSSADVTFNWDFGDSSGALISREPTVTHTYVTSGTYKPKVVIQAVIPDSKCANASTANSVTPPSPSLAADLGTTVRGPGVASAAAVVVSSQETTSLGTAAPAGTDMSEDATEEEVSSNQVVHTPSPVKAGFPSGPAAAVAVEEVDDEANTAPSAEEAGNQAVVKVAKRQADDSPSDDGCAIYRYGSFCTGISVVEGIENVEIIQVKNAVVRTADAERSVVDITVTCEGSLPSEVCSVVLDAECMRPVQMECNAVDPASECQLVLRHFFENSGVFCINVSLTNEVSLAVTSARVNVRVGSGLSSSGAVSLVLGVLILAVAVGTVAHIYKRLKLHRPLKEDNKMEPHASQARTRVPGLFWNLLDRQAAQDHCPLLQDRLV